MAFNDHRSGDGHIACDTCGLIVHDPDVHTAWHRRMDARPPRVMHGPTHERYATDDDQ
jgi:hypothetical protein